MSQGCIEKETLKKSTIGIRLIAQLQHLRKKISATSPHYILCLKPNEHLRPDYFVPSMIYGQLKGSGIFEVLQVSRACFPERYTFSMFLQRYEILLLKVRVNHKRGKIRQLKTLVELIARQVVEIQNRAKIQDSEGELR